jgi:hypothetical protein
MPFLAVTSRMDLFLYHHDHEILHSRAIKIERTPTPTVNV